MLPPIIKKFCAFRNISPPRSLESQFSISDRGGALSVSARPCFLRMRFVMTACTQTDKIIIFKSQLWILINMLDMMNCSCIYNLSISPAPLADIVISS